MKCCFKFPSAQNKKLHHAAVLFLLNFCILLTVYSVMYVVPHYNADVFAHFVHPSGNIGINAQHGRYVAAGLYWLFEKIHFDYTQFYFWGYMLLFSILSAGVSGLTVQFAEASDVKSLRYCVTLDAVMLTLAINLSVTELLLFPDIPYSVSMLYASFFLAILFWCKPNRKVSDCLLSFLFLSLCLDIYQVFIGMYVILAMAYVFIEAQFTAQKDIIRKTILILLIGLLASIQSLALMMLPQLLGTSSAQYVSSLSVQQILNNAATIWSAQGNKWFGFDGFLPKAAPGVFMAAALVILTFTLFRRRIHPSVQLLVLLGLLGSWFMSFAPYFLAANIWMPPRTLVSMFAFIALPGIWLWALGNDRVKILGAALYAVLLIMIAVSTQKIAINNYALNTIDQEICNIISQKMAVYESENNVQIDTIAVGMDDDLTWGYSSIEYTIFDTNMRSFCCSWGDVSMIEFYTGRSFKRISLTRDEYSRIFGNQSWDYFDSDEQIIFDGSTMYLAIY